MDNVEFPNGTYVCFNESDEEPYPIGVVLGQVYKSKLPIGEIHSGTIVIRWLNRSALTTTYLRRRMCLTSKLRFATEEEIAIVALSGCLSHR